MGTNALTRITDQPVLDRVAEPLSHAVREAFERGGPAGQRAKNVLRGVWLGHPFHPVFVDMPIGAWTTAMALDVAANDDPGMRRGVTFALGVGLVGALCAAVTGLTDWSDTQGRARRTGLLHGLLNVAATSLIGASFFQRMNDSHTNGRGYAWSGYALALMGGYLGGDLVFGQGVGVMHAGENASRPDSDRGEPTVRRHYDSEPY
jgi:uncharacterized membrane protein